MSVTRGNNAVEAVQLDQVWRPRSNDVERRLSVVSFEEVNGLEYAVVINLATRRTSRIRSDRLIEPGRFGFVLVEKEK